MESRSESAPYAFQIIFTALAPRLIQSISRNVHNKNIALKRLCVKLSIAWIKNTNNKVTQNSVYAVLSTQIDNGKTKKSVKLSEEKT